MAERVERRADDLTARRLSIHEEDPEAFTLEEIRVDPLSLKLAGHRRRTTSSATSCGACSEPGALGARGRRSGGDPERVETLRFDPSVLAAGHDEGRERWRRRAARGRPALPLARRAGRDASIFPDPDAFDVDRDNARRHLAFGRGIHLCLGSSSASSAELALAELTHQFPRLALVEGQELSFTPNISFRGPQALWVVAD